MKKKYIAVLLTFILVIFGIVFNLISVSSATYTQDGDWKYELPSASAGEYYIAGYLGTSEAVQVPALFQGKPVTQINNNVFLNNSKISYIELPATIRYIGMNSFYGCTALGTVIIPKNVTEIGPNAFYGCTSLEILRFSSDTQLKEIPRNCFSGCTSLVDVSIPQGIETISDRAFFGCTSLRDIIINPSVTSISDNAFSKAENVRILGWNNTYAQTYAAEHNITFFSLGDHTSVIPTESTTQTEVVPTTVPATTQAVPTTPVSTAPVTSAPVTTAPVTSAPATSIAPSTGVPTTAVPTTAVPTTAAVTTTVAPTANEKVYLIGDTDLSGVITVKDATLIQKYAADLAPLDRIQLFLANCNSVGGVNIKDATAIQKYCAGFSNILFVGNEVVL